VAANKSTSPAALRAAQAVIEAMADSLGSEWVEVYFCGNTWEVVWGDTRDDENYVVATSLDDARIAALHKQAGTEPAPF
jgi:hypothetical protein